MPEATNSMLRVTIQATIEEVWREISKADEPTPAFFNNRMPKRCRSENWPIAERSGEAGSR